MGLRTAAVVLCSKVMPREDTLSCPPLRRHSAISRPDTSENKMCLIGEEWLFDIVQDKADAEALLDWMSRHGDPGGLDKAKVSKAKVRFLVECE